ncbi:MAG: methyltransferase domain-containing protein [Proteobacteria bacterium]|nr:methyltransferase domain-containing protein [Pseudomonadota bacterium]
MGFVFDKRSALRQEAWFQTETGREVFRLQAGLIMRLLRPLPGERVLDVGCGSGLHLQLFKREGLNPTGIEPSPAMIDLARARLGRQAALYPGRAEDLPFEDNTFDVVCLITCLEFMDDPEAALAEAFRVARGRVFVGVLNALSLTAAGRRLRGLFKESIYDQARFFSLWEMCGLVRRTAGPAPIQWASAGLLPLSLVRRTSGFEARPLVQHNPFGAFLGLAVQVTYTLRAAPLPADPGMKIRPKTVPTPTGCGSISPHSRPNGRAGRSAREAWP